MAEVGDSALLSEGVYTGTVCPTAPSPVPVSSSGARIAASSLLASCRPPVKSFVSVTGST